MLDKIKNWSSQINWKRFRARAKFVITHALVGGAITGIAYVSGLLFGPFIGALIAGLALLVGKEVGEVVGKLKAAGTFENDFNGNKNAFIDAIDDKWHLWQTVGAMAIVAGVVLVLKYLF